MTGRYGHYGCTRRGVVEMVRGRDNYTLYFTFILKRVKFTVKRVQFEGLRDRSNYSK